MKKILAVLTGALVSVTAGSAFASIPVAVNYSDPAGYGFKDVALGAKRRVAFEAALATWTNQLQGNVPLAVDAHFEQMGGDAYSAVLAYAGPVSVVRDFAGSRPSTWYVSALANQLAGTDLDPSSADVEVVVNSDVDNASVLGTINYYYGTDGNSGNHVDFRTTILHELGHGLGFLSFVDTDTGELFRAPGDPSGLPDAYTRLLTQSKKGYLSSKTKHIGKLRPKQRLKAMKSGKLRWMGESAFADAGYMLPLYAPEVIEPGSSVSHWDTSIYPDLLMEPYDSGPKFNVDMTREALTDMGWKF